MRGSLERKALDRWITGGPQRCSLPEDEYDPPCPDCGHLCSDHGRVQITDEANGVDYETVICPPEGIEPKVYVR